MNSSQYIRRIVVGSLFIAFGAYSLLGASGHIAYDIAIPLSAYAIIVGTFCAYAGFAENKRNSVFIGVLACFLGTVTLLEHLGIVLLSLNMHLATVVLSVGFATMVTSFYDRLRNVAHSDTFVLGTAITVAGFFLLFVSSGILSAAKTVSLCNLVSGVALVGAGVLFLFPKSKR